MTVAVLLATPLAAMARVFFTDDFTSGSTINGLSIPGGTPNASFTSYDIASTKNATASAITSGDFVLELNAATISGFVEAQALFTTNPVILIVPGDYIDMSVVFTNGPAGNNVLNTPASLVWAGLFNSGGSAPLAGDLVNSGLTSASGSGLATGNCANWFGYVAQISSNGISRLYTRPVQNESGTTSANQDLVANNAGTGAYNNPIGTVLAAAPTASVPLSPGGQYTLYLRLTLAAPNSLTISNSLYVGAGTGGTMIFSQMTNTTYLATGFNGLAIGAMNKSGTAANVALDITAINIGGVTQVDPPPIFEPMSVVVATNGSCAFTVDGLGFILTYQWHRNGTNLLDGGNISGATSPMLVISPAGTNDEASGTNGYYVTVTGPGGYSVNSTNVSLALCPVANLVWSGNGSDWDVATSSNWFNGGVSAAFNYGDNVIFDDTAGGGQTRVNLENTYLSPASMTVNNSVNYTFTGSGSIAGPGTLIYEGSGPLIMACVNSYSGGTIISNTSAYLVLSNTSALGGGPVTLARSGGQMEIVQSGNAVTGIQGDVIVADDFTIQLDGNGAYSGVFLGNLSGTVGKTLTLMPQNDGTTNRIRIYGTNMVYNANLMLNGTATGQAIYNGTVLATYESSGSQIYNGIISGNGGLVQRGSAITILNGANTYAGGTTPTTGAIGFGTDTVGAVVCGPIGTGPLFLSPEVPNTTGTGGVMAWNGAHTIANPIQYPSATNNLTLVIGGTNALTFTGAVTLNGNDATGSYTNRTFQVTNTALTTFSGVVSDSGIGFGLTKTGSGILALNNIETYTGSTSVSNGTLQINGTLNGSSVVNVCSNGILAGTGIINGPVSIQRGGLLAPGTASMGTLTLRSNLDLAGNMKIRVDRSGFTSDKAIVSGPLNNTGAGTVIVTNTGETLRAGDTFILFNKAVTGGGNLKVAGAGVAWNNQLGIDGTIIVASTNPPIMGTALSGSTLTLSWPGYPGWLLQSNSVSLTATNWFAVPDSGVVTTLDILATARTNVFYRLLSP